MAATIKIKNSSTTGAVPTSGDLVQGELAVNVTDTGLYTENASGTVVKLNAPSIDDKNTGATKHLTISTAGNLGLGVTPSAWKSNYKTIQYGSYGSAVYGRTDSLVAGVSSNWYENSSGSDIYISNGYATRYQQVSGAHSWLTAASGTAGNAITFTQAMTLDASGRLGLNVTSPATYFDVAFANLDTNAFQFKSTTGTNAVAGRFNNTGGTAYIGLDNSTGSRISGSSGAGYALNLWHEGAYPILFGTSNTERARIDSSGNLLVGGTAVGTGTNGFQVYGAGSIGRTTCSMPGSTSAATTLEVYSTGAGAFRFYVGLQGQVYATNTTISAISDIRFKENVRDLNVGLAEVMALRPRLYDWKEGKGADIKNARGFIAQEFEQVFPDLIDEWKDEAPEGEEPYKSVRADLIPVLVKAIQELKAEVDSLKAQIAGA